MRGPEQQDDPEKDSPRIQSNTGGRRGLHSPLLNLGTDEEEPDDNSSSGMFPHRSSLPRSGAHPTNPPDAPPGGGIKPKSLRSPLLGGDNQFDEEEEQVQSRSGRSSRLRSPVLGGPAGQYEEDLEPPPMDDDPNTLRSPLLARRVKPEVSPPSSSQKDQGSAPPRMERVAPDNYSEPSAPQPAIQPVNAPPPTAQPVPPVVPGPSPSLGQPGYNQVGYSVGFAGTAPADNAPTQAPSSTSFDRSPPPGYQGNATWPIQPQSAMSSQPPAPPAGPPKVLPPPGGANLLERSTSAPAQQSRSVSGFGSDTESGAPAKADVQYGEALPPRSSRTAGRSKFLSPTDSAPDRYESYQQPRPHLAFAKFMLIPLLCAAGFKVWYLYAMGPTALQSMPFLGDQVSQLVVIVCLMIFIFLATAEISS
jgi:hypothetical protein